MKKYYCIALLFLLGCHGKEQSLDRPTYWDLAGFFEKQQAKLQKSTSKWHKRIEIGQNLEEKVLAQVNWEKELALFKDSDLNKTAYQGNVQHIEHGDSSVFRVTDPQLPIQRVVIKWNTQHQPTFIQIESSGDNMLYQTSKKLTAQFEEGELKNYQMETSQQVIGLNRNLMRVFVHKKGS